MKVVKSEDSLVEFDNGLAITGEHEPDCCESNYLDFEQMHVGREFPTMDNLQFVKAITLKDGGFWLKDIAGIPIWVQARSDQNGWYTNGVSLAVHYGGITQMVGDLAGDVSDE